MSECFRDRERRCGNAAPARSSIQWKLPAMWVLVWPRVPEDPGACAWILVGFFFFLQQWDPRDNILLVLWSTKFTREVEWLASHCCLLAKNPYVEQERNYGPIFSWGWDSHSAHELESWIPMAQAQIIPLLSSPKSQISTLRKWVNWVYTITIFTLRNYTITIYHITNISL